ncbi:MAG: serine hydrolase [Candidatus Heimdallarchaeota archaeon]|nr:serine hydrolase [Candidatus Heimdallarchaeota archaeon]
MKELEKKQFVNIFGKNQRKINNHILRIEKSLPQVKLKDGLPTVIWKKEEEIQDRMKALAVPGISVAVINNFELEWIKCYGIKDVRTKEPVTVETLFEGGSVAKAITATATLSAAIEKRMFGLDVIVNDKLQSWKIPETEYTRETKITLRHLLAHTAGINRPDSMFGYQQGKQPTLKQVFNGEAPATNDPVEVLFTPGTDHKYSNFGYVIIQKFLEDVSGKTFPNFINELVFKPLNMQNSFFGYPTNDIKEQAIVPHNQKGEAEETGIHPTALAMGGLVTTPFDLSKFVVELMKASKTRRNETISSAVAKKMLTPAIKLEPEKWFGFTGQGLGMFLIENEKEVFFTHPGTNMPGATCLMIGSHTSGQGAIIMANGINGELVNLQLLFAIAKEYNWTLWR